MKRRAFRIFFLVFFAGACAVVLSAQTGSISGTVKDSSGAQVAGAQVTVRNLETNLTRATVTNGAGVYTVVELPVGKYEVAVKKEGFKAFVSAAPRSISRRRN